MSDRDLTGRVAVVTGAASGIGAATAVELAAQGAKVALLARRADRLTELADKIAADGGQALAVAVDVTDDESVTAGAARIHEAFGRVDLVVNAAGVMIPRAITEGNSQEWTRMIDTNITGVLRIIKAFSGDLIEAAAGGGTADLVNISSIGAHLTFPNYGVYVATKAAVTHLSNTLRTEFGPKNVRVTNVEPGLTKTELADHIDPAVDGGIVDAMFAAMEYLTSEDIAELIGFVTSRPRRVNLRQAIILPTQQA